MHEQDMAEEDNPEIEQAEKSKFSQPTDKEPCFNFYFIFNIPER